MENTGGTNKTLIWIAAGCLALVVCILAVILFGFSGLYWLGSQTAEEVTVLMDIPVEIRAGSNVILNLTVKNVSDKNVELVGIDFSMNYLDGIVLENTIPPYTQTYQYDSLGGGETFQTYTFNQPLASGEVLTIIFNGKAIRSGDFSGSVAVCVNSIFNCVTNVARTIVK
ncbi:MAG: hypothetical protein L6Q26_10255 [Anaerolineales bacterium]|nr:hypothetical protein [Anaerolineales bacterium]NUQ86434.1 hypothetical protein [Anaerolineales bacterium]